MFLCYDEMNHVTNIKKKIPCYSKCDRKLPLELSEIICSYIQPGIPRTYLTKK